MKGEAGVDYPEERSPVDVRAESRDDILASFVESVGDLDLLLTVGLDRSKRRVRLEPGERLELTWRGPEELRCISAEVDDVDMDGGNNPTWRVRTIGSASRGQRRAAVRAPLVRPMTVRIGTVVHPATTVDLSEGGARLIAEARRGHAASSAAGGTADGAARVDVAVGTVVSTVLDLGTEQIDCESEVIRRHARPDDLLEISVRFIGLGSRREDAIRRHVFEGLRELRSRGLI